MDVIAIKPYLDTRNGQTRYFDQHGNEYNYNPGFDGLYGFTDFMQKINPFKKKEGGTTVGNFLRNVKDGVTRFFAPDASGNPGQEVPAGATPPVVPQTTVPAAGYPAITQASMIPDDRILGMPKQTAMIVGIGVAAAGIYYLSKRAK